jgi:hypothetical protein
MSRGTEFVDRAAHAIGKAIEDHAAERTGTGPDA